jgi:hypothetical protein
MNITTTPDKEKAKLYIGLHRLPEGSELIGTVTRGSHDSGALVRLATGIYVQYNAGMIRSLPMLEAGTLQPTVDLMKLARELGGILWTKVPGKERVYLERGPQSKRVATKCYVFARLDGTLGVRVTVERKKGPLVDEDGFESEGWANYRSHQEFKTTVAVSHELEVLGYQLKPTRHLAQLEKYDR